MRRSLTAALSSLTPKQWSALAAVLLAFTGITIAVIDDDGPGGERPRVVITVPLLTATGDPAPVTTPAAAVEQARAGLDDHQGSRSEQPAGVSGEALDAARVQQEALAERDDLPVVTPLAAASQTGCTTRRVANQSSRRGVAPRLFVLHYTVSPNRPGWTDVWGIADYFNRAASSASSHYVIDAEGNCAYIVPETAKAWTQATFNPVSISVEIIATGKEGRLYDAGGKAKLARVVSDSTKRWGIPLQVGKVSGCTVTRPGVVDHRALGACGGGHVDVSPYSASPILAAAKAYRAGAAKPKAPKYADAGYNLKVLTAGERGHAKRLLAERRIALRHGGWGKISAGHLDAAKQAKAALEDRKAWLSSRLSSKANRAARFRTIRAVVAT